MDIDESTMEIKKMEIKAGSKFLIPTETVAGDIVSWWIKTESHDLSIGVDFKIEGDHSIHNVVHNKRFTTSTIAMQGCYTCETNGIVEITLDNSFSYFKSKSVRYRFEFVNL